jgi:hypothetical protein
VIAADGSWIDLEGQRKSLARRGALRRILCALEICRVGWPGKRMCIESARTLVCDALRLPRGMGLDSRTVTTDAGYVLAVDVAVGTVASGAPKVIGR